MATEQGMTEDADIVRLLAALEDSEILAKHGYSAFATPAGAVVVQKDRIFHGLWRMTEAGLKWTPAAASQQSAFVATVEAALRHTILALGLTVD